MDAGSCTLTAPALHIPGYTIHTLLLEHYRVLRCTPLADCEHLPVNSIPARRLDLRLYSGAVAATLTDYPFTVTYAHTPWFYTRGWTLPRVHYRLTAYAQFYGPCYGPWLPHSTSSRWRATAVAATLDRRVQFYLVGLNDALVPGLQFRCRRILAAHKTAGSTCAPRGMRALLLFILLPTDRLR